MLAGILYTLLALGIVVLMIIWTVPIIARGPDVLGTIALLVAVMAACVPVVVLVCRGLQLWLPKKSLFPQWKSLRGTSIVLTITLLPFLALAAVATAQVLMDQATNEFPEDSLSDEAITYPDLPLPPTDPYDWSFRDLEGKERSLAEFKGQVLFVNLWATWCQPCLMEMPSLQQLYDDFKEEDRIQFLFLSKEAVDTLRQFVEERGYTFPVFAVIEEQPELFRWPSIPCTVIVTGEGQVAYRHDGAARWDTGKTKKFLLELVERTPVSVTSPPPTPDQAIGTSG